MSAKSSKQKQTFSIKAPGPHSILLAGDFTGWARNPLPLQRQAHGVWTVSTALASGIHYYRFIIDGEWCDDPECHLRVQNPYGSQNAVIQVPSSAVSTQATGSVSQTRRCA